jgi:hypothetical protein
MLLTEDKIKPESTANELSEKSEENLATSFSKKDEQKTETGRKYLLLKKTFTNWSKKTDINGYSKIFKYKKNYVAQFLWLVILLALTGATFWLIAFNIQNYLSYNVVSQTEIVFEKPSLFPTITICDNDAYTTKEAEYLFENISYNYGFNFSNKVNKDLNYLVQMETSNPSFGDEQRKKIGFDLNLINFCSYGNINCNLSEFHWYWSYDYGNCWQYNSGLNLNNNRIGFKSTNIEGRENGLYIVVFPVISKNKFMTTWENGLVVFVHNSSFKPSSADAIYVKPGEMSFISVRRVFTNNYPFPYSDCIDLSTYSSYLYNYIIKSNQVYRQFDCFKLCIQQNIIQNCGCYNLEYSSLNTNLRPCLNLTDYVCLDSQKKKFNAEECQANSCPLECNTIKYDLSYSSLINPGLKEYNLLSAQDVSSYSRILGENLTYDTFKSIWVNIWIYYPTLQYTQITVQPKISIIDLFTQIGGSLGLFVSFSVFTLFELIEIFVLVVHVLFIKRSNKISTPENYSTEKL